MRFADRSESEEFFRRLGAGPDGRLIAGGRAAARFKTARFFYESGAVDLELGAALARGQGDFSTCMVWAAELVFGDHSLEEEDFHGWAPYRRWRRGWQEKRSLYEAPGHVFMAGEQDELARVVDFAIRLGWDALVGSDTKKPIVHLSHNDLITLYARSRPADLLAELSRLGLEESRY
jgi:hypothetical protein